MQDGRRGEDEEVPVPPDLEEELRRVLSRLARGDYDALVEEGIFFRATADDLRAAVDQERSWATFIEPPADAYRDLTMRPLNDGSGWWFEAPVWTAEDSASDLSLVGEFIKTPTSVRLLVSDLDVL
jgi:hypothetical protein